jgi:hypothetical protein
MRPAVRAMLARQLRARKPVPSRADVHRRVARIVALHRDGEPIRAIARAVGLDPATVRWHLDKPARRPCDGGET